MTRSFPRMTFARTLLAALSIMTVGSVAQADESEEAAAPMKLVAQVHSIVDGLAIVSIPLDAKAEADLLMLGFRPCARITDVEHHTIFAARAYVEYQIAERTLLATFLAAKIGETLTFELTRDGDGRALIVDAH
jgi:hypothetical protein